MTPEQKSALIELIDELPPADLAALERFAEFLLHRARGTLADLPAETAAPLASAPPEVPEPELIERPADEKVVAAVKRLSRTYYMLDKKKMLGVTSELVTQHLLQGREAIEVIDELEEIFRQHYRQMRGEAD
jgi:hypothetical protein